jgi:hypothetical protein
MTINLEKDKDLSSRAIAIKILEETPPSELGALQNWVEGLLDIRERDISRFQKAKESINLTRNSKIVWRVCKIIAKKAKKIIWDDSSKTARWGMTGAAVGVAVFGGKSAGFAALGTAIGVPLWVVLGAGASFAGVFIDEIKRRRAAVDGSPTYTIIDAVEKRSQSE